MNIFSSPDIVVVVVFVLLFAITITSAGIGLTNGTADYALTLIEPDVDYQSIVGIRIDLPSIPNTIFTIFPSEIGCDVTIETSPPNLVTVTNSVGSEFEYGGLSFEWNTDVSSTATSGSVRIGVPLDQLKEVLVNGSNNVQILDGFTNIEFLYVNDYGTVRASMTSLISTDLTLWNKGGQMYVETNVPVIGGSVFEGGQSWVETPSFNGVWIDNSELTIEGDVDFNSKVNRFNGFPADVIVSYGAHLTVTSTITGSINSQSNSTVNAPSCDNVTSSDGSICNAGLQNVDVDVDVDDFSLNNQNVGGTYTCRDDSSSSPPSSVLDDSAVTSNPTPLPVEPAPIPVELTPMTVEPTLMPITAAIDVGSVDDIDPTMISSSSSFTQVYSILIFSAVTLSLLI